MKAREIYTHMNRVGTWVDWERSVDRFYVGDPESDVKGIAVSWMATLTNLKKAWNEGCNLFVTHEPLFPTVAMRPPAPPAVSVTVDIWGPWVDRRQWCEENGMIVYRCHDVWDDYPEIGIHASWADWLGFVDPPVAQGRLIEAHPTGDVTLEQLARRILKKVKPLGQEVVYTIGDLKRKVSRIALGTGAITPFRNMQNLDADVLLLSDDGARLYDSAQWALDSDKSLIIVNHATSEEPGVRNLATYIQKEFQVPVIQIPVSCLYRTIMEPIE